MPLTVALHTAERPCHLARSDIDISHRCGYSHPQLRAPRAQRVLQLAHHLRLCQYQLLFHLSVPTPDFCKFEVRASSPQIANQSHSRGLSLICIIPITMIDTWAE